MGLAGPRNKQRISADPQNKAWSNDTGKFGFKMLQKMGWTPGKGLGVDQQGSTSHVSVVRKEDNLGVGANVNTMDNWLSNTDAFSKLLKDLNERIENETEKSSDAEDVENEGEAKSEKEVDDESSLKKQDKKDKKKKKKEKKEKKKKSKKDSNSATSSPPSPPPSNPPTDTESTTTTSETTSLTTTLSHARYAHRAKFLRNKRVNNYDSESLEAILGVKKAEVVVQERIERGIEKSEIQESTQIKTMTIRSDVDEYKPSFSYAETTKTTKKATTDYIYGSTRSISSDAVAENNDKRQNIVNSISKSLGFSFVKGEVLNGNDDKNDENDGEEVESDSLEKKSKNKKEKTEEKKKKKTKDEKRKREALESEEKNEEESEGKKKKRKSKSKEEDVVRTEKDEKSRKKQEKKKSKKGKK